MLNSNTGSLSQIKKTAVQKGSEIEQLVCNYLQTRNLQVCHRNFRCRWGEIDLICQPKQSLLLIFVEVRFRRHAGYGGALANITYRKQQKLIRTARFFLLTHPNFIHHACRFDVVAVTLRANKPELEWVQNAFH